eukprot:8990114-Pyramimonas_sp.AAC.1
MAAAAANDTPMNRAKTTWRLQASSDPSKTSGGASASKGRDGDGAPLQKTQRGAEGAKGGGKDQAPEAETDAPARRRRGGQRHRRGQHTEKKWTSKDPNLMQMMTIMG